MGSRKKQTVGYRYYLGMLYTFCQGPVDRITHLYFDENLAWSGDWSNGDISIDRWDLFGGDDKEGGVRGTFQLIRGDQLTVNPYLESQLGEGMVSAYHGTVSIVAKQPYLGNSAYLKPMSVVMQAAEDWQWPNKPQWYKEKAKIPYNAVYDAGGLSETPDTSLKDEDIREGLDVWIVFSGNFRTNDRNDLVPMADMVRDAVNFRLDALSDASEKKIHLGLAVGTWGYVRQEGENTTTSISVYREGSTDGPDDFSNWNSFNFETIRIQTQTFFGGLLSYYGQNLSDGQAFPYMMNALNNMGRLSTPRNDRYKHGVVIYLGDDLNDSHVANIRNRYLSTAGGTFQLHTIRPQDIRRRRSPYDFFYSRIKSRVIDILENRFPAGSNTNGYNWNDGINLDGNAIEGERPSQKGNDINPAHILRECIVSPIVGLGEPEELVDAAKAEYAADLLFAEGFGMSIAWSQEGPVEDFMQVVCDHANITTYVSNQTGLWVIKPIRGDYDLETIPTITEEDDMLDIETLTRRLPSEGINAVTVKYYDIDRNDTTSIPVYNTAAIQQRGGVIDSTTVNYDGILREDLAYGVGERDLLTLGYPIVTGAIFADRSKYYYEPGDVFWLDAPSYGVLNEVMRVVDVDYGNDEDLRIRIEISSDIYALEPQPMERGEPYVPPNVSQPPTPMLQRYVEEASYFLAAIEMTKASLDAALVQDPDVGGIYVGGPSPAGSLASAQVWETFLGEDTWRQHFTMEFGPSVLTDNQLTSNPLEEEIQFTTSWVPSQILEGALAALGSEMVRIKSVDIVNGLITVARGALDTVPEEHPEGTTLLILEGFGGFIENNLTSLMQFEVRLLPFNGTQVLPRDSADGDFIELRSRMIRPYPAAKVRIDGVYTSILEEWDGEVVITWVHRNRLQQTNLIAGFTESGLTPEAGLTYLVRVNAVTVEGVALPVVYELDVGLVTTTTVDLSAIPIPPTAAQLSLEIVAVRDGYENWTNASAKYTLPYTLGMGFPTLWWDTQIPSSMRQTFGRTGLVDEDMDQVRSIANVADTLP